jgi:hypothetical protein
MNDFLVEAKKRFPQIGIKQGDWFETEDYPDSCFDVVTGFNAVNYVENIGHLLALLRNLDRITKPGLDGIKRNFQFFDLRPDIWWYGKGHIQENERCEQQKNQNPQVLIDFSKKVIQRFLKILTQGLTDLGYDVEKIDIKRHLFIGSTTPHQQKFKYNIFQNYGGFIGGELLAKDIELKHNLKKGDVVEIAFIYGVRARKK